MDLLEERVTDMVEKIASEQGYKNYTFDVIPISTGGANYTSVLYKIKIKENNKDDLYLFAKVGVMAEGLLEKFDLNIYEAERCVYTTIKTIFTELQDRHKVPKAERFVLTKYYGANTNEKEEILVMEDLTAKGFSTHDRHKPTVDWAYASASVKTLAKFHALAMAFQKEYPEEHDEYVSTYKFEFNEDLFTSMAESGFNVAIKTVRDENREKLKRFFSKYDAKKLNEMQSPCRKPVLIHSDYRPSNLMHLYREDGSVEIIPVDLQTVHLGCVIFDLIYFVISATDKEFRRLYFQRLIDHYFTELTAAMARLGVESSYYTKDDFDFELKERLPYGLVVAGYGLPWLTVATEDAPELGTDFSTLGEVKTNSVYVERLNGVVDDYVQWGLL